MSTQTGTLHSLARHLVLALQPLQDAVSDLPAFRTFLYRLGWDVKSLPPEYTALAAKVDVALTTLNSLGDDPQPTQILTLLGQAQSVYQAVSALSTAPDGVDATEFLSEIGQRLFELLLVDYLTAELPAVYSAFLSLGVITQENVAQTPARPGFLLTRFHWDAIPAALTDPASIPARVYGWGTGDLDFHQISGDLLGVFLALGWPAHIGHTSEDMGRGFMDTPGDILPRTEWELRAPILLDNIGGKEIELGLALLELPPQGGKLPGLILQPAIPAEVGTSYGITDTLRLELRAGSDVAKSFGVLLRPGEITVRFPFDEGATLPDAGFGAALRYAAATPVLLLGDPSATRMTMQGAAASLELDTHPDGVEITGSFELNGLSLVLSSQDQDGFLSSVIGDKDATFALPLKIQWSSRGGVSFGGSQGLTLTDPTALRLGGVTVEMLRLALRGTADAGHAPGLVADVSASLGTSIGPFSASVSNIGIRLTVTFADGNAGPFEVAIGFLPPSGAGLGVDAPGVITGGGFIDHDPVTGRYSGLLQLHAGQVGITGRGMVDSRVPGSPGYALLVALQATFPAIQIGLGFALTGVGGLLALNRRVDVDALRGRLAAGTAGRILAPQDPVRNAPALLADLDTVFPVAPGITVLGPTAQLLWAGLVHLDVGVFIELPGPARVVLLGSAHAEIERDGRAYLSIRVDIVGVVDLRAETAAFDAVLVDSHLMGTLDLTGGAAFRLSWGAQPYAVLSLGGFNPAYHPEPLAFPATLAPIAMVHGTPSDDLYLRFEGYFAITSNTLQFGASVEALIHSGGFTVHGTVGFDALIQFVPFHFQFDIRAQVSVGYGGQTLAGLTLTGSLSGPGPVVLRAKVCIELLFFDICFSGTFPLGPATPPPAPVAADLLDLLLSELTDPGRLRAAGPPDPYVRLAPPGPSAAVPVVAPGGTLVWEQQRAPLDLLLTRAGGAPLPAPAQVTATSPAGSAAQSDWFAPGQFTDLTDDEALTRPAYELLTSGLQLAGAATFDGPAAQRAVSTTQIRLPANVTTPDKPVAAFPAWIVTSAAPPAAPAITVETERWTVITPAGELIGLTGAQARQLATLTPGAQAIPAADRLDPLVF